MLAYNVIGGNNRARTYDPLLVRQMLSQLSYASIFAASFRRLTYYTTTNCVCQVFFETFLKVFFVVREERLSLDGFDIISQLFSLVKPFFDFFWNFFHDFFLTVQGPLCGCLFLLFKKEVGNKKPCGTAVDGVCPAERLLLIDQNIFSTSSRL